MRKKIKNTLIHSVTIERAAAEGKCIARYEDQVVFVEGVAPGDIADIRVIRKKRNYLEGIPVQIHHLSPLRAQPFCAHFGVCGGCKWQHITYDHQLAFKRQQVVDSLERIAKVPFPDVLPTLGSSNSRYYRNKLEFTFSNRRWLDQEEIALKKPLDRNGLGFHKPRQFDKVVDIKQCYLQPDPSNQIRLAIKDYAMQRQLSFYDISRKEGFLRNLIIRTSSTGEIMVIVQVGRHDEVELIRLLRFLQESFPEVTSLQYVVNTKGNETYFDLPVITFYGQDHITEKMENLKFRIGPKSFYQTNSDQAYELYKLVRSLAGLTGKETVYDLYSGTGTIALFLSQKAHEVVGLELVPEAVADARVNADLNHITNTTFYSGDIKENLDASLIERHGPADVLVTDPPRAGMHREVVEQVLAMAPANIIYVSCNPATQARDIAALSSRYRIGSVQPLDMFPHTHHVESIIHLQRQ